LAESTRGVRPKAAAAENLRDDRAGLAADVRRRKLKIVVPRHLPPPPPPSRQHPRYPRPRSRTCRARARRVGIAADASPGSRAYSRTGRTAMSMCFEPAPQPLLHGGQRFFFCGGSAAVPRTKCCAVAASLRRVLSRVFLSVACCRAFFPVACCAFFLSRAKPQAAPRSGGRSGGRAAVMLCDGQPRVTRDARSRALSTALKPRAVALSPRFHRVVARCLRRGVACHQERRPVAVLRRRVAQ
jgi:hypothetical protein